MDAEQYSHLTLHKQSVFTAYVMLFISDNWRLHVGQVVIRDNLIVSAYRYIATANLPITAVFGEYLRQFLIDLHQIYRHSSVPKNTSPCFLAQAVSEHGAAATFFCHVVPVTV